MLSGSYMVPAKLMTALSLSLPMKTSGKERILHLGTVCMSYLDLRAQQMMRWHVMGPPTVGMEGLMRL